MAKHLTDKNILDIVTLLDDWPEDTKLTWFRLVEAVQHDYGIETTRQTLQKQTRIKLAFTEVKQIISGAGLFKTKKSLPPSLKIAAQRLAAKEREVERLKRENMQLLEQFHVWLYNAYRLNIKIEELNTPLPQKDNQ